MTYECGICGSRALSILAFDGRWDVRCGNGHVLAPTTGVHIIVDPDGFLLRPPAEAEAIERGDG